MQLGLLDKPTHLCLTMVAHQKILMRFAGKKPGAWHCAMTTLGDRLSAHLIALSMNGDEVCIPTL
jgi:hypothetical protein